MGIAHLVFSHTSSHGSMVKLATEIWCKSLFVEARLDSVTADEHDIRRHASPVFTEMEFEEFDGLHKMVSVSFVMLSRAISRFTVVVGSQFEA